MCAANSIYIFQKENIKAIIHSNVSNNDWKGLKEMCEINGGIFSNWVSMDLEDVYSAEEVIFQKKRVEYKTRMTVCDYWGERKYYFTKRVSAIVR